MAQIKTPSGELVDDATSFPIGELDFSGPSGISNSGTNAYAIFTESTGGDTAILEPAITGKEAIRFETSGDGEARFGYSASPKVGWSLDIQRGIEAIFDVTNSSSSANNYIATGFPVGPGYGFGIRMVGDTVRGIVGNDTATPILGSQTYTMDVQPLDPNIYRFRGVYDGSTTYTVQLFEEQSGVDPVLEEEISISDSDLSSAGNDEALLLYAALNPEGVDIGADSQEMRVYSAKAWQSDYEQSETTEPVSI